MVMRQLTLPVIHAPPPGSIHRDHVISQRQKEKVVVILGATGTGKSRLSIDIASCFPSEIVNSDKIQVHRGLDIVTNKISEEDQSGVPHHLLGTIHPDIDFTAVNFCHVASSTIQSISNRGALPIIAGGSNSYIDSLVMNPEYQLRSKYDFCFLWVDVAMPVLHSVVSNRVDKMVRNGMVDEVRKFFNPNGDYSKGVRKAIGVPELDRYFRYENEGCLTRARLLEEAIEEIKNNTCDLASKQLEKIHRFQTMRKWNLHRLDATEVFRKGRGEGWEETVSGPATMIVAEFLYNVRSNHGDPFEAMRAPSIEQSIAL